MGKKTTAERVAAWMLASHFRQVLEDDVPDSMTNMKLQKMLYYAQGAHLALTGNTLFDDPIIAWKHGPVVENVYRAYREFGHSPITCISGEHDIDHFDADERGTLQQVFSLFGDYSASELRNMSHAELPWQLAWKQGNGTPLDLDTMADFFTEHYVEA